MKSERRLEILEAFASSKPTEFDGYLKLYEEQHPEVIYNIDLATQQPVIAPIGDLPTVTVAPKIRRPRTKLAEELSESETEAAETP